MLSYCLLFLASKRLLKAPLCTLVLSPLCRAWIIIERFLNPANCCSAVKVGFNSNWAGKRLQVDKNTHKKYLVLLEITLSAHKTGIKSNLFQPVSYCQWKVFPRHLLKCAFLQGGAVMCWSALCSRNLPDPVMSLEAGTELEMIGWISVQL